MIFLKLVKKKIDFKIKTINFKLQGSDIFNNKQTQSNND